MGRQKRSAKGLAKTVPTKRINKKRVKKMTTKQLHTFIEKTVGYKMSSTAAHLQVKDKGKNLFSSTLTFNQGKLYIPPTSPHCLIQELFFYNPYMLTVSCIFLNRTQPSQVRKVHLKLRERNRNRNRRRRGEAVGADAFQRLQCSFSHLRQSERGRRRTESLD